MKKFKSHSLYFPFAMVLSLSPMALKSIHKEIKPHYGTRSLASISEDEVKKVVKYEKESFEKNRQSC